MKTVRCQCGQPLAAFAAGLPGTPLQVSAEAMAVQVVAALRRHQPDCPLNASPGSDDAAPAWAEAS
jgi:hypothetical protein